MVGWLIASSTEYGNAPEWFGVAALIAGAIVFRRGGGGTAIGSLEAANRVLEKRVHDLEDQGKLDSKLIAELKARTDVSAVIQPLLEWTHTHEERDQIRFEKTLEAMAESSRKSQQEQERIAQTAEGLLAMMDALVTRLSSLSPAPKAVKPPQKHRRAS